MAGLFPISGKVVVRVIKGFFLSLGSDTPTSCTWSLLLLVRRPHVCIHSSVAIGIPIQVVT